MTLNYLAANRLKASCVENGMPECTGSFGSKLTLVTELASLRCATPLAAGTSLSRWRVAPLL
eukprot:4914392-Alexandrium_andersonii.AAC.1